MRRIIEPASFDTKQIATKSEHPSALELANVAHANSKCQPHSIHCKTLSALIACRRSNEAPKPLGRVETRC